MPEGEGETKSGGSKVTEAVTEGQSGGRQRGTVRGPCAHNKGLCTLQADKASWPTEAQFDGQAKSPSERISTYAVDMLACGNNDRETRRQRRNGRGWSEARCRFSPHPLHVGFLQVAQSVLKHMLKMSRLLFLLP